MGRVVNFDVALVVRNISILHQELIEAFNEFDVLDLDISEDHVADLCGVQLIESARRYAVSTDKRLSLLRPAEQMRPLLEDAGFLTDAPSDLRQFWLHEGPAQ